MWQSMRNELVARFCAGAGAVRARGAGAAVTPAEAAGVEAAGAPEAAGS